MINVCCFKPPSLWPFATAAEETKTGLQHGLNQG